MIHSLLHLRAAIVACILLVVLGSSAAAQIEVSPTRVLLTLRGRAQEVNVYNSTDEPVEVTTDLGFKLITSDSLGRISLRDAHNSTDSSHSCKEWVKLFPRRFMLEPRSSRSVRVLIVPPDSLRDGEYWGRVIFRSHPVSYDSSSIDDTTGGIRSSLKMRLDLDIPIIFRKGNTETGIALEGLSVVNHGKGMLALLDLRRLGNSAYRGTIRARVLGEEAREIGVVEEQFTSEFTLRKGVRLPKLPDGRYKLELDVISMKRGGATDVVLPAPTVTKNFDLTVSPTNIHVSSGE